MNGQIDRSPETDRARHVAPWRVLLVDDEADVHNITKLVLRGMNFEDRPLEFVSAFSASQARDVLAAGPDFAVAIINCVMETDTAGLELIRWIREEFAERRIRLILRTGGSSGLPERQVIQEHDIDDYREKSSLTDITLLAMLLGALRNYRDIRAMQESSDQHRRLAVALDDLLHSRTVDDFAAGLIQNVMLCSLVKAVTTRGAYRALRLTARDARRYVLRPVGTRDSWEPDITRQTSSVNSEQSPVRRLTARGPPGTIATSRSGSIGEGDAA